MKLPEKIEVSQGLFFKVIQKKMKQLGYTEPAKKTIAININQPEPAKWLVLLHEIMHIADIQNNDFNKKHKRLTEKQVTVISGTMFCILASSGIYGKKFSKKELTSFINNND